MAEPKILLLVEGEKTDVRLMKHLFEVYGIDLKYTIVPYKTNIYTLYNEMFKENRPDETDILRVLKSREKDEEKKKIFDDKYSDIILIFDLDPQDNLFDEFKIKEMVDYFVESSDMGKLYINYPMVELFYYMKDIPDKEYNFYSIELKKLKNYKEIVNKINRNHNYTKFAINKKECNIIIKQNLDKAFNLIEDNECSIVSQKKILNSQLLFMREYKKVLVLCTCIFFIYEYNKNFIKE